MGYKTFEDMKHCIPEGATHYQNESEEYLFAWFDSNKDKCYVMGEWKECTMKGYPSGEIKPIPPTIKTESPEEREALDMIDTTSKQVDSLANNSEFPNSSKYDRGVGGPVKLSPPEWSGDGLPPVGAECEILFKEYQHKGFGLFNVLAYHGGAIWVQYIGPLENNGKCYTAECSTLEFRKPESPEQKADRERLEAAFDLYCHVSKKRNVISYDFEWFCNHCLVKTLRENYLAIVDKTGYRKDSK